MPSTQNDASLRSASATTELPTAELAAGSPPAQLPPIEPLPGRIRHGTPEYRRTNLALFLAGFSTFALLYDVQPLLPVFTHVFQVQPATSSLSLSLSTGMLAFMMLVAGSISDRVGRKPVMSLSMVLSAALTLASAFVGSFTQLLVLRLAIGVALSGVPAIAMAYLGEEMEGASLGAAMGLFIGGSAFGGLFGRLTSSILADFGSWRWALGVVGAIGLAGGLAFWRSLPASRYFNPRPLRLDVQIAALGQCFATKGLPWLFLVSFLLMGSFVTMYNYVGYRLIAAPFDLSQAVTGLLFSVYLIGIFASAWMGKLADRLGRRKMLWAAVVIFIVGIQLTRPESILLIVLGVATATFGFFGGHSIASSWVSRRSGTVKAQAASLYLFFYYVGSSVAGSAGGFVWKTYGWEGIALLLTAMLALCLVAALRLTLLKPLAQNLGTAKAG